MLSLAATLFRLTTKFFSAFRGKQCIEVCETPKEEAAHCALEKSDILNASTSNESVNATHTVQGFVTSMHHGYGLINGVIYFDLSKVKGDVIPTKGDQVLAEVNSETSGNENLVAESVELLEGNCNVLESGLSRFAEMLKSNEDKKDETKQLSRNPGEQFIGKIISVLEDTTIIDDGNEKIEFKIKQNPGMLYEPVAGDWVSVEFFSNDSNGHFVVCVKPLRQKEEDGVVTYFGNGYIIISNQIYYKYAPGRNGIFSFKDQVQVVAVESSQNKFEWRALSVVPKSVQTGFRAGTGQQNGIQRNANSFENYRENKNGIDITKNVNFLSILLGDSRCIAIYIKNEGTSPQQLIKCHLMNSTQDIFSIQSPQIQDSSYSTNLPLEIRPNEVAYVNVVCKASDVGCKQEVIVFEFEDFTIMRQASVNIKPSTLRFSNEQYNQNNRQKNNPSNSNVNVNNSTNWIVPGRKLDKKMTHLPVFMPTFPVPYNMWEIIQSGRELLDALPILSKKLNMKTYKEKFGKLLYLEEIQQILNMKKFDMRNISFHRHGDFLSLLVPGLAEGRPSIIVGDRILAAVSDSSESATYEGYIHEIFGEKIHLKFHEDFHRTYAQHNGYNVEFQNSRTSFRRLHQAVNLFETIGESILFPLELKLKPQIMSFIECIESCSHCKQTVQAVVGYENSFCSCKCHGDFSVSLGTSIDVNYEKNHAGRDLLSATKRPRNRNWFNKLLNKQQKLAVQRILEGRCRPTPYVIFGPPGTGKTITMVEAVLQVYFLKPDSRILVCATSNSVADLFCERLFYSNQIQRADMVRLNAHHRSEEKFSDVIKKFASYGENRSVLCRYRIVVGTNSSVGYLYNLGIPNGHFTHIFIDEAGQAFEPECLIPICLTFSNEDALIVLSGDPHQLGPVIFSAIAGKYGLRTSFLERILCYPIYLRNELKYKEHGCYNPLLITKLVCNYRSHPSILHLPNQLFYHSELEYKADVEVRESLCNWEHLPNPNFPIIFHCVRGEDMRESDSPSWFNPAEVVQVLQYLKYLYASNLKADDIGIITPYRKQVEKLGKMVREFELEVPKIGSVEEFQGQEKKVIIVSTVRASEHHLHSDRVHKLGFVANEKRFNVIITRAQALLIVVGDAFLLLTDKHWRDFLEYCIENKALTGIKYEEVTDPLETAKAVYDLNLED